jgi:hypothetical protein
MSVKFEFGFMGFTGMKGTAERRVVQETLYVTHDQSKATSASKISKWYEHHVRTRVYHSTILPSFLPSFLRSWFMYRKGQKREREETELK